MQLHRREADLLLNWLNKKEKKPLILRGARQVGKSSLVRYIAQLSQKTCLELNFERYPEYADFFQSQKPATILNLLSIHFKHPINPDNCILFFDEIQAAPQLIATLRYFYEEYPQLPIIAAGSLLEFALAAPAFSMPVGRIEYFHLGPMVFEDFLKALGEHSIVDWLQTITLKDNIPLPLHQRCIELVKQFWLIGGMPEVIANYVQYRNFEEINNIRHNILQTYQDDFHKYGRIKQIPLLRRIFKALPALIGQKIKYSHLDPDNKSTQIKEALEYLNLAKVIHFIFHSHANGVPLNAQIDPKLFKTIFLDIGLLCTTLGLSELSIIHAPDWAWINRGSLAEQFIGQTLFQLYPSYQMPELTYWIREKTQSAAEIDYLWQYENQIFPIEVKAGKTGRLKSLHYFMHAKQWRTGIRFNADLPSLMDEKIKLPQHEPFSYQLLSLPFYLASQLNRLLALIIHDKK